MAKFETIQDMEEYYYGGYNDIYKVDAPVLSTTTGVLNTIFGKFVWALFNQEANVLGLLPKVVWEKSGWRLMTARAGTTADGGVAEGGTIPDSIKPTFLEVTNTLKTNAHVFEVSEIQEYLVDKDDGTSDLEVMRQLMGVKHKEAMNQLLLTDVSADAAAATANFTGRDGFETIDRVVSSDSEEDAFGGTYTGFFDIFGLDRDSATTFDSNVDHNSGTDRAVSDELIRTSIYAAKEDGGQTTVIITGWDTVRSVVALYSDQVRYNVLGEATISVGVNGIQTEEGINTGIRVASLYGIPQIATKDMIQDTISRMFFLDTSDPEGAGIPRLGLSIAKPTQYFQAGIDDNTPFAIDKFTTQGMYRTMGEVFCTTFQAQAKLRDLS